MTKQLRTVLFLAPLAVLAGGSLFFGQQPAPPAPREPRPNVLPRTPLPQAVLDLLADEISGQIAFNNEIKLAGAPWLREEREFTAGFHESETIAALARGYGVADVRIDRFPREATFDYPAAGEFWTLTPEKRLIARLEADPALVGFAPAALDVTGGLVYIAPLGPDEIKALAAGPPDRYAGRIALMWSQPGQEAAKALDAAGLAGVVSFSSRDRYFDPDQVVYGGRGGAAGLKNLRFAFNVSWRQWSELVEDVEAGRDITVRATARVEKRPDRFENVVCVLPGTEPGPGVIFSAHLFEGYVKRGANDNMSGCAVQLEILRALHRLIETEALPRPRRSIVFLWPQEISGTFEQIRRTEGFADRFSVNINMDMVGEGLRGANAVMTMSECPNHLPSYLDGLAEALMNYVWRTNDIVYLADSPRGRPGGQYFPRPLWEKNGSRDAFRYFVHEATGGSDHVCFNNPSVGVPGIELFTWPDPWYHADADTPDKSDPTQMKRIAFIGAAAAWTAANCDDGVLPGLLDAVSSFGYARVGKRELARAMRLVGEAGAEELARAAEQASALVELAAAREKEAVESVRKVWSGSDRARTAVAEHVRQWELYGAALERQVRELAAGRAAALGVPAPVRKNATAEERRLGAAVPELAADVRGREFAFEQSERYKKYVEAHPDAVKGSKLGPTVRRVVLNYIDGRRTLAVIRRRVEAETGAPVALRDLSDHLAFLRAVGWLR